VKLKYTSNAFIISSLRMHPEYFAHEQNIPGSHKNVPEYLECTCTSLRRLSLADSSLMIDSVVVQPTDVVRDLGVLLDSELNLKQHVNRTASACFYHLRRLRQLKRHVNVDVMKRLISAFVFSRLDYCNGILSGLPLATIAPLQRVQNAAARLVLGLSRSDHVRPALKELHWLPLASGVPNQVQGGTGDVHNPHTSVPRLPGRFCTPLHQQ